MSVPGAAVRAQAARVLAAVLDDGRSLKAVLAQALPALADPRDRGLLEAICFAALRQRRRYERALSHWLQQPLPPRDRRLQHLLLAGLAQLDALGLPAHAAVAATAEAARDLGRAGHVALVNAILRRASREPWDQGDGAPGDGTHPRWLERAIAGDWPDQAARILAENLRPAPQWLRVAGGPQARVDYRERLQRLGIEALAPAWPRQALRLPAAVPVDLLPGWREGEVTVQDAAAQLPADALALPVGAYVLDACAAPGGKTAQLAERLRGAGELLALDIDEARLRKVDGTLQRLRLASPAVVLRIADAGAPSAWWDGRGFDAILLDAPCSATGIIRRQPDILWHRRDTDIPALVARQARLLDALWPLLRPGGELLYATCSILKAENERQLAAFLARTADARAIALPAHYGQVAGAGRQRLPGDDGTDGFYCALVRKQGSAKLDG